MSKATRRYIPEKMTRSDLAELADGLKRKSATEIFRRLGIKRYVRQGATYKVPGLLALQGLPKKAPVRVINDGWYYSAEELIDLYKRYASDRELERLTR